MDNNLRVLGLDVGQKRIGVAVTDEVGLCAHAVETFLRKGTTADVRYVAGLAQRYGTQKIVVGMPYQMDGSDGQRAKRVRVLADALAAAGLEIALQDERDSTVEAEAILLEADLGRKKRKQVIDRLAAQRILEAWLGNQR